MNETLSKFRPIPEDKELKNVDQQILMGFDMPQVGNEIGKVRIQVEEGTSPQWELCKEQSQSQPEDLNVTQINIHQMTGAAVSNEHRTEVMNERPMPQPIQDVNEEAHGPGVQTSHNLTDLSSRGTDGNNIESTANNNPRSNMESSVNNNPSIQQTSNYRSKNLQNQPHPSTQQYTNTMPYTIQSQN